MKLPLACLVALLPFAASAQKAEECGAFRAGQGEVLCLCAAGPHQGSVWGDGPYTADSDICTAAVHAGAIGAQGGRVIAQAAPGLDAYPGSTSHGVTSFAWGAFPDAFTIVGGQASAGAAATSVADAAPVACRMLTGGEASLTCACPPLAEISGSVWGSGPYTADSNACLAAVHAGAVGPDGGTVTLLAAPGQDNYPASTANGVATSEWGAYGSSFEVEPSP